MSAFTQTLLSNLNGQSVTRTPRAPSSSPQFPVDVGGTGYISVDLDSPGGRFWKGTSDGSITNKLDFQYFAVSEFQDGASASYNSVDVLGRSESYQVYQQTETREITLGLKFAAQGGRGEGEEESILREVKLKCDWCRALNYPVYKGGRMYPPPLVDLYFGKMYVRNGGALKVIVTSTQVAYCSDEAPMTMGTFLPYIAQVDMSFKCVYMNGGRASRMLGSDTILRGAF